MLWLILAVPIVAWLVLRRKKRTGPELDVLRRLIEQARETATALEHERHRVRTLVGAERAIGFGRIAKIDRERAKAKHEVERLRASLEHRGYDVSGLTFPTIAESEDAALLEDARAETEREIG